MLFHFFTSLVDQYSFLNVFKYLTFRTGLSVMTSLIIVFMIGGAGSENMDPSMVECHDASTLMAITITKIYYNAAV